MGFIVPSKLCYTYSKTYDGANFMSLDYLGEGIKEEL